jgi:small-conductance mechanosensitive channel/CRP-like cAMP-binding protein
MRRWFPPCASLIAILTLTIPANAAFAAQGDDAALQGFGAPAVVGTLCALLVVMAYLVNRFAADKRKHVRRTFLIVLLYVVAVGIALAFERAGYDAAARGARTAFEALGIMSAISLTSVLVFDLALPAVRLEPPRIITDILVGAAYVIATFVVLRRAGFELLGLVTTSAVLTGILVFSLQSTLGNIFGGVALQFDESIRPGDWIQLESGRQGKVKQIRWRHTVIETRDWDTIIVPNAALLAASFTILGKRQGAPVQHRMWVHFGADFKHRPGDVIKAVEDALRATPMECVAADPPPNCICFDIGHAPGESSMHYAARYWLTDLARDDPTSSLVRARIYAALERAGIHFSIPATKTQIEIDDAERRQRRDTREHNRRLAALDSLQFLGALTEAERATIADSLRYAPFAAGETITRQGAIAHWLYILTDGVAEVQVEKDGHTEKIAQIGAPGFFGEMGCMTGQPRAATVIALSNVVCYRLDKHAFVQILTERPDAAREISELLAERRVGLGAARHNLDEAARKQRVDAAKREILPTLQAFFGLRDEAS